ncbi:MAG: lipoyl(octanoyl) transferase LipB [Alphaproteobacteria bacterium]|nr:lipoyl(octanoyl) transferase LipB [Alphaproteobacteria bacterium]
MKCASQNIINSAINDRTIEWEAASGLVPYAVALAEMEARVGAIVEGQKQEKIWLVEHSPVYTAGTSAKGEDLLHATDIPVFQVGRGGQYTYHGPGQRVGYVMLDLKRQYAPKHPDIRDFVYLLEEWIIQTLAHFGIRGERRKGRVGVWVISARGQEDKIAAIGVKVRRWVTFHGISINVNPDLTHYRGIVPCGIREFGVTSFSKLGINISLAELDTVLNIYFRKLFLAY